MKRKGMIATVVLAMVVVGLLAGLLTTPAAADGPSARAQVVVEVKETFVPEWAKQISPQYLVSFDHLKGGPFKETYQVYPGKNSLQIEPGPYLVSMQTMLYDPNFGMYVGVAYSYPWEGLGWVEVPPEGIWMDFYGRVPEEGKGMFTNPPISTVTVYQHLIFRVRLVGRWNYPVAVEAVVIPSNGTADYELQYQITTVEYPQRWVRFDFGLPKGDYKLKALAGKPGKWYPDPYWTETGLIPLALDRDKDVTLTLDP